MAKINKNDVEQYMHAVSAEVKTKPLISEYTPALAATIIGLANNAYVFLLILAAMLFYRFYYWKWQKQSPRETVRTVTLRKSDGKFHTLFTSMRYGTYKVAMPTWLYTISGFGMWFSCLIVLSWSFWLFPVAIWLFNWGATYIDIGSKYKKKEEALRSNLLAEDNDSIIDAQWQEHIPETPPVTNYRKPQDLPKTPKTSSTAKTEKPENLPPEPDKSETYAPNRYYTYILKRLVELSRQLDNASETVHELLDDLFGQSEITKRKYLDQINYARKYVAKNLESARRAIKLFGSADPTEERRQILEAYVQDSVDVVDKVNCIIDALVRLDQGQSLKNGDQLDESLNELAATTKYYQRS